MPNVHLTETMTRHAQGEAERGAHANIGEVIRAGMRLPMARDGARGWFEKAALEDAVAEVEAGKAVDFDPVAFAPDAFAPDAFTSDAPEPDPLKA